MDPKKLLEALREQGVVDDEKINSLSEDVLSSAKNLEEEILKKKWATDDQLAKAKSLIFDIPFLDLSGREIDPDVLNLIPENTVKRYEFVPLGKKGEELIVGMVDPGDVEAREALKFVALQKHLTPKIYTISRSDLKEVLGDYRTLGGEVGEALEDLEAEIKKEKEEGGGARRGEEVEELSEEAPVTKVVAVIVRHAVEGGASDIHIEPLEEKTRVRFRVDGILHSSIFLPKKIHPSIVARIKIVSSLKIDETRKPQDGRFQTKVENKKIDFRVSTLPTSFGEKVVLRILDPTAGILKFKDLGLIGRNLEIYKKAIQNPFGLVLITGPTGSGKSTTLYTTLTAKNSEEVNMVTLEDPVEYYIEGVNQSQIKPEIDFSFASGLRSILRQDPDIIMVGEIRDKETASLVTHAALTGHLVFSTLHTNDSVGIIPRLVNMGIQPYLLPPTLLAGVAQRLVRKLCPDCKKAVEPSASEKRAIEETLINVDPKIKEEYNLKEPYKLYKAEGCTTCGNTGTKGRVAVFETFKMTPELENIILGKISETELEKETRRQGMVTMKEDGIMKAILGYVSMEEVLRVVED